MSSAAAATAASTTSVPRIAIIGAGASGLAVARVFSRNINNINSNNVKQQQRRRRLRRLLDMEPIILEKDQQSGGVWHYEASNSSSPSSSSSSTKKSKPMYRGLRTNLPKEIMQFREFPFEPITNGNTTTATTTTTISNIRPSTSFLSHKQVLDYLRDYQTTFDITKYIQYGCEVSKLEIIKGSVSKVSPSSSTSTTTNNSNNNNQKEEEEKEVWPQIRLEWKKTRSDNNNNNNSNNNTDTTIESGIFDAVCVCNGHYSKPSIPHISGLEEYYNGTIMHSIEYDDPSDFSNLTVLCIGGRASGSDIAREISPCAKHVYLSDSSCTLQPGQEPEVHGGSTTTTTTTAEHGNNDNNDDDNNNNNKKNITWVPTTKEIKSDGSIQFDNCTTVTPKVDCIIFCTGYDYEFPFIIQNDDTDTDDNDTGTGTGNNNNNNNLIRCKPGERRVMPLYEQVWHARYPTLSFVGIPHSVVPFPEVEFQAEAIHAQYCIRNVLPTLKERMKSAQEDATSGDAKNNGRIQDTHYLGGAQWDYCRKMAKLAGIYDNGDEIDDYLTVNQLIYEHSWEGRKKDFAAGPDTYREIDYQRDDANRTFTFHKRTTE